MKNRTCKWATWFAVAMLAVCALVGCASSSTASSQDDVDAVATAGVSDSGASSVVGNQASSEPTYNAQDDTRAQEFAVDPNANTEWRTKTDGTKTIWLTFDDGPSENTQKVLDILNKYNVKATFFVTGIKPDYAYMIKKAYEQGNTIGLHTYSHDYATVYASESAYFDDLDAVGALVKEQIGYVPCFIRFPGGSSNAISAEYTKGIMSELVNDVQDRGYQYFDWNISCGDGASGHTAEELAEAACDGDDYTNIVLLMHDSAGHEATVEALPTIIEHYQSLGYTFKAIDRSALASHHGVNN